MQAERSSEEESRPPRTVYLVDDHSIVRLGFSALIDRAPDLEVSGTAATAEAALEEILADPPDLSVVDLRLEGPGEMGGLELIEELNRRDSSSKYLVVSMHRESLYAERALEIGAMGYLMKSEGDEALLEAVRTVLSNRIYLSARIQNRLLETRGLSEPSTGPTGISSLSAREEEVFTLIGQGRSSSEIAESMSVSVKTVGTHRRHIQKKLGIEKKARLRVYAVLWQRSVV